MEQRSLDAYYDSSFQCEEIQDLAGKGIQMVDKIRNWYSRKHAQFQYNANVCNIPSHRLCIIFKSRLLS